MSDSNRTKLSFVEETTWGTTPSSALQILRFFLGQICLHFEPGLGQVQGIPIIHYFSHGYLFIHNFADTPQPEFTWYLKYC